MRYKSSRYSYTFHRGEYRIYEWRDDSSGASFGTFTGEVFFSKKEAKKRVYQLNGWSHNEPSV